MLGRPAIEWKLEISNSEVCLHPLVIVNITDHFTRANLNREKQKQSRVVGALFGVQDHRRIEVFTSFEAMFTIESNGRVVIDTEFLQSRKDLLNQVYPNYEILGWYTTGNGLTEADVKFTHNQIRTFTELPVVMVVDTNPSVNVNTLPVYVFDTTVKHGPQGAEQVIVRRVKYIIESEESERIGIDTAMKVDFATEERPTLVPQAQRLRSAVEMLKMRTAVVLTYLKEVKSGKIKPDAELLRQISSLCNQLPCADSPSFESSFQASYQDALLMTYLAVLTKSSCHLSQVVDKSQVFSDRRRPMMGMMGAPFGMAFH